MFCYFWAQDAMTWRSLQFCLNVPRYLFYLSSKTTQMEGNPSAVHGSRLVATRRLVQRVTTRAADRYGCRARPPRVTTEPLFTSLPRATPETSHQLSPRGAVQCSLTRLPYSSRLCLLFHHSTEKPGLPAPDLRTGEATNPAESASLFGAASFAVPGVAECVNDVSDVSVTPADYSLMPVWQPDVDKSAGLCMLKWSVISWCLLVVHLHSFVVVHADYVLPLGNMYVLKRGCSTFFKDMYLR